MKNKTSIPEISEKTKALIAHLLTLKEGEMSEYNTLSSIISIDVQKKGRQYLSSAMRALLVNENIVIASVHGKGVKRLAPSEITTVGTSALARVNKGSRRAIRKLKCADFERLTNEQKIKHNLTGALLGAVSLATSPKRLRIIEETEFRKNASAPVTMNFEKTFKMFE